MYTVNSFICEKFFMLTSFIRFSIGVKGLRASAFSLGVVSCEHVGTTGGGGGGGGGMLDRGDFFVDVLALLDGVFF